MAYYQSNSLPPQSSQEAANQFMNGFVDYEGGTPEVQEKVEGQMEIDIDPMLRDAVPAARPSTPGATARGVMPNVNGTAKNEGEEESPIDPALMDFAPQQNNRSSNGVVLPSTETTPAKANKIPQFYGSASKKQPQTPRGLEGSAVKSVSPEATRSAGKRKESSVEATDPETRALIEQLRQENLSTKGLRRRS
jgi:hypothetical protein